MKYFLYIILILLIIVVNFGLLEPLGLGGVIPGLLLLVVICLSMEHTFTFVIFAVLGGVWLDIFYSLPLGSFAAAYLIIGFLSYAVFRHWLAETNWKYYIAVVVAAEALLLIWLWGFTNLAGHLHFGFLALSGRQLLHYTPALVTSALISAFPVYSLVNIMTRVAKRWWRQPMQLS